MSAIRTKQLQTAFLGEQAGTLERRLDHFREAVAIGERLLGEELFRKPEDHFWNDTTTRPCMRARFGLAGSARRVGRNRQCDQADPGRTLSARKS
jgi:hypothetical protein